MKLEIDNHKYEVEATAYLKVFYPLGGEVKDTNEQPSYRISVTKENISVAYFDGDSITLELNLEEDKKTVYKSLEGLEKKHKGKLYMKQLMLEVASSMTGIVPPWGILMGIRPTKLASRLLFDLGEVETHKRLLETYRMQEDKVKLLLEVLGRQSPYVSMKASKHSVYIGIPFCPSRCSYCSFTAYCVEKFEEAFLSYTDVLIKEMKACKIAFQSLRSIYIGGGTPTSLTEKDFDRLLGTIRALIGDEAIEFTVEAGRVDSITKKKLESMKRYGVNRLSINPQTIHDKTLVKIGRNHNFLDVEKVYKEAREMGFDHINMDLILGLPGESVTDSTETIEKVIQMAPESITVHTMALKRGTVLTDEKKSYLSEMSGTIDEMLRGVSSALSSTSYHGYYLYRQKNMVGNFENVGYCLEGKESIYNIHTMEEIESIIAFGAGAISKRVEGKKIKRLDEPKDVKTYIKDIDKIITKKQEFFKL